MNYVTQMRLSQLLHTNHVHVFLCLKRRGMDVSNNFYSGMQLMQL